MFKVLLYIIRVYVYCINSYYDGFLFTSSGFPKGTYRSRALVEITKQKKENKRNQRTVMASYL